MMAMALLCAITTQAYTITVAEQQNCTVTVSPQKDSYDKGEEITVNITPATGAVFDSFEVYCECTESEWWEINSYKARRRAPAPRRASGFTYRAELYNFADDDWEEVTDGEKYTFIMPDRNVEIEVLFTAGDATYGITKTTAGNGSTLIYVGEEPTGAATDAISATLGTTVNIRTTPANGYYVDEVKVFEQETIGGALYESLLTVNMTDNQHYSFTMPANPVRVAVTYGVAPTALTLYDNEDNSQTISKYDGITLDVALTGRTLWKDGSWNTLCLPFDLELSGSVLDGDNVDVRTLAGASFSDGTLTLNFTAKGAVTTIDAGKPYIIKWDDTGMNLTAPVFSGVTVESDMDDVVCDLGGGKSITFKGTYASTTYDAADRSILFLGESNTLYYPIAGATIGAQRAYFQLVGIEAGDKANNARAFVLSFGDDDATRIISTTDATDYTDRSGAWYSLDGRRLDEKPTQRGIYINNGRKVVIK